MHGGAVGQTMGSQAGGAGHGPHSQHVNCVVGVSGGFLAEKMDGVRLSSGSDATWATTRTQGGSDGQTCGGHAGSAGQLGQGGHGAQFIAGGASLGVVLMVLGT